ncbi:DUF2796 domain-containing protein [Agaribacterium sp. ZY112]|uniref:DUF2796 domain-containing protein n=1 Tax=Agaribacterium sp. ZY112 TaxID=3233574 RepID=UPI0035249788
MPPAPVVALRNSKNAAVEYRQAPNGASTNIPSIEKTKIDIQYHGGIDMLKNKHARCTLVLLLMAPFMTAQAQHSHTHGLAVLTIALENEHLEIEFESPSANLVGFEHKAHTQKEKESVKKTKQILEQGDSLFSFGSALCIQQHSSIDTSSLISEEYEEHEHHNAANKNHSEIVAHYQLNCKKPQHLKQLAVELFKKFPGIEKINVMWITESNQGSTTLTPSSPIIPLK